MTNRERRGRLLFLILSVLIVLDKLFGAGLAVYTNWPDVRWLKGVIQPLGLALGVVLLWDGDTWLRWLMGTAFVVTGGVSVLVSGWLLFRFAEVTPPAATGLFVQAVGYPLGIVAALGLFHLTAGLLLLLSPSMRAFFRYQREGPTVRVETV